MLPPQARQGKACGWLAGLAMYLQTVSFLVAVRALSAHGKHPLRSAQACPKKKESVLRK